LQSGDTANFYETYDSGNVGTNKTLTPAGSVTDGNGGANYSYTFVADYSGVINPKAPSLVVPQNQFIYEQTTLVVTNFASEAGMPTAHFTFSIVSGPTNMVLDAVSGVIAWTPTEAQGPSINNVVVRVTDDNVPPLSDTRSFTVFVNESNTEPVLSVPASQVVPVGGSLSVMATATDVDQPAQALRFSLVSGPSGLSINPTSGLITWTPASAQRPSTNLVTVRVTDNGTPTLNDTESFSVRAAATDDTILPVVALTAPAAKLVTSSTTLTVTGTARDNRGVASVLYSLNGGGFIPAAGTTIWSATIALIPGTNTITVTSVDGAGNVSLPVTRSFYRIVNAPLTLNISGYGTVTPNLNGAVLEVNQTYTLTAIPSTYNFFTNWSGGVSSTNLSLKFVMQSNLVITANFATNRLVAVAGSYNGLFSDTNGAAQESAGFFTLKTTPLGVFTGKVLGGGGTYPMSGKFDVNGHARVTVPRLGKTSLAVDLQLDLDTGSDQVAGTVGGGDWTANLLGDRALFNAVSNPARSLTSKYTMLVPGTPGLTNAPTGNGYGLISVAANGTVTLAGELADGARITQAVPLAKTGEWPLYVPLYSGPLVYTNSILNVLTSKQFYGAVIGWVTFTSNCAPTLNGLVVSIKKPLASQAYYPAGFTNQANLLGSSYTPPAANVCVLPLTNAAINIRNGDLPAPINSSVAIQTNNTITVAAPNVYGIKMLLTKQNGLLKGAFISPVTGVTKNISGALLQNLNYAGGYFLGTNSAGSFTLQSN
jgi:hypothetical protein